MKIQYIDYIHNGARRRASVSYDMTSLHLEMMIDGVEYKEDAKRGNMFWSAFNRIRLKVGDQYKFLCNGARVRAYVSPLVRDANAGLMLYACNEANVPDKKNLRFIFAEAPEDAVGSVEEHRSWLRRMFPEIPPSEWDGAPD